MLNRGSGPSWENAHEKPPRRPDARRARHRSRRRPAARPRPGQTSYDPRFIRKLCSGTDTWKHSALAQLYGVDLNKLDSLPKAKYKLFELTSPIAHLTKDDAPAMLIYRSKMDARITSQGVGIHHPRFGKVLKERMDKLRIECQVKAGIGRGGENQTKLTMDFLRKHLGV